MTARGDACGEMGPAVVNSRWRPWSSRGYPGDAELHLPHSRRSNPTDSERREQGRTSTILRITPETHVTYTPQARTGNAPRNFHSSTYPTFHDSKRAALEHGTREARGRRPGHLAGPLLGPAPSPVPSERRWTRGGAVTGPPATAPLDTAFPNPSSYPRTCSRTSSSPRGSRRWSGSWGGRGRCVRTPPAGWRPPPSPSHRCASRCPPARRRP